MDVVIISEMCIEHLKQLKEFDLVTYDAGGYNNIFGAMPGRLMARYNLKFGTMKLLHKVCSRFIFFLIFSNCCRFCAGS